MFLFIYFKFIYLYLISKSIGKPVKIFGTIKYYKKNATINGAKMILIKENELIQHFMEVAHSWMYLTGKLQKNEEVNINLNFNLNVF